MSNSTVTRTRNQLSADGLFELVRTGFEKVSDPRSRQCAVSVTDALMSAFAMFSLKDPSLLAFEARRNDQNLLNCFRIKSIPSDTAMREILDPIKPSDLRPVFSDLFRALQRGKALEPYLFYKGCYLALLDGTGLYSSDTIHCESCLEKVDKTGKITYSHQMLAAVIAHPDHREVIPLAPEAIVKQDGSKKNDCERNAGKRLLQQIREDHPHLKLIIVEDALASNAPHIQEILSHGMHFILGAKPGDHRFLFDQVMRAHDEDRATILEGCDSKGRRFEINFINDLPLNATHPELRVNYLQFLEFDKTGRSRVEFTWVTDFEVTRENALLLCRGGRARWHIENETFNTLKNQGYHFEHNYGHGYQNLAVNFAMLMMLAFLADQVQQLCCPLFQAVWKKLGTKRLLWDRLRACFALLNATSMRQLYEVLLHGLKADIPTLPLNSS